MVREKIIPGMKLKWKIEGRKKEKENEMEEEREKKVWRVGKEKPFTVC
jgi:hypothetical protein